MAFTTLTPEEKQKRKEERKRLKYKNEHKIIDGIDYKICSKCKEYKPSTGEYFYKNKSNSIDGLSNKCIECEIKRAIQWKKDNPEKYAEAMSRVEAKPKRILSNRKRAEKQRKAGKQKEWQNNNPDKVKEYSMFKRLHKKHNINPLEWLRCKEYFNNQCAYCGLPIAEHYNNYNGEPRKEDLQKEHVDHFGVNDLSNCVPGCKSCNCKKWEFTFNEWYNENNPVFTKERYNKIMKWINTDHKLYIMSPKPKQKYTRKEVKKEIS